VLRATVAATAAYFACRGLTDQVLPIFGPITALLTVQASPFAALGASVQRILGTALGVALAGVWVNAVGTTWWSFPLAVLGALVLARALPLSLTAQMQVPIAVVFVMAIGPGTLATDLWRVIDVLIGGAIGVACVYLWPPRVETEPVQRAAESVRSGMVALLRRMAEDVGRVDELPPGRRHAFIDESRLLQRSMRVLRDKLDAAVESARFNPRALRAGDQLDELARLVARTSGLSVQVRALAGAVDRLYDHGGLPPALPAAEFAAMARTAADLLAVTPLADLAALEDGLDDEGQPIDEGSGLAPHDAVFNQPLVDDLGGQIRSAVRTVSAVNDDPADVLDSLALLGRLDHLRGVLGGTLA
jgi:uncharacterized membrane protein YccC